VEVHLEAVEFCRMISSFEYVAHRNAYSYPRVGLSGSLACPEEVAFPSTTELDCHQNRLLRSDEDEQTVLGYLSTIFWGHYIGKGQVPNPHRALSKVKLAIEGRGGVKDRGAALIAQEIRAAYSSLMLDRYADALRHLCDLPQLGLAFASKVCAFLLPAKCGVIDSVIAERYPCFDFSVEERGVVKIVKRTSDNRLKYAKYCSFLQQRAQVLNSQQFQWKDQDGACYPWRAVDVERALYEVVPAGEARGGKAGT
jgi:hypothetical protein